MAEAGHPEPETIPTYELPDTTLAANNEEASTAVASSAAPAALPEQFITTSTNAVPASIQSEPPTTQNASMVDVLAISPQTVLQVLYVLLGLFVVAALSLSLALELRRHNPIQVAYSLGLLLIMSGLYYLQTMVISGATIV